VEIWEFWPEIGAEAEILGFGGRDVAEEKGRVGVTEGIGEDGWIPEILAFVAKAIAIFCKIATSWPLTCSDHLKCVIATKN
jgi:hypothetical protein